MTRRICSGCGHTLIQPSAAGGAWMSAHMDEHAALHEQRGEACRWIVDATSDRVSWARELVLSLAAFALCLAVGALIWLVVGQMETRDFPQDEILLNWRFR